MVCYVQYFCLLGVGLNPSFSVLKWGDDVSGAVSVSIHQKGITTVCGRTVEIRNTVSENSVSKFLVETGS